MHLLCMASWLVHSTPERAVRVRARVRALAGDILLCSWAFLGKTLHSHGASLHPGVNGGNPVIPSRGCLLLRRFDFSRKEGEAGELEARETGNEHARALLSAHHFCSERERPLGTRQIQGGVEILPIATCYGNLRPELMGHLARTLPYLTDYLCARF